MHIYCCHRLTKSNHLQSMKLVNICWFFSFHLSLSLLITLCYVLFLLFQVLGAGGNTFNEIRRQRQSHPLKTMRVKSFLSSTDVMPLTIRITKSGNISVAITGQPPFIAASDPNVLDIKYISFRLDKFYWIALHLFHTIRQCV